MSSIAYITDSNMLELHRLNGHNTMNFWRLSTKTKFKDFSEGDLVFFLSKDKDLQREKEKGIVGYGKLERIHLNSINYLWNKYKDQNGYPTLDKFKEAILKVSKNDELPKQISSLYLKDVLFFQSPVYLSECGMEISGNVESFIYLKPEVTVRLLNSKIAPDMFFESNGGISYIEEHKLEYAITLMQESVKDIKVKDSIINKGYKHLKAYIQEHPEYTFVKGSKLSIKKTNDKEVTIMMFNHKDIDRKLLLGQASAYRYYLYMYYPEIQKMSFKTTDENNDLERMLNN